MRECHGNCCAWITLPRFKSGPLRQEEVKSIPINKNHPLGIGETG